MANVTITSDTYREATYLDCSIVYNDVATISGVGLTASGTLRIDDSENELSNGDSIYVSTVQGTVELNDRTFELADATMISGSREVITTVSGVPTATGIVYFPTTLWDYTVLEDGYGVDMTAYTTYVSGTGQVERWATTISGLEHLEGNTVTTLAEGAILPDQEVVDGTITLPYPIKYGIIGLGYDSYVTTMPLEVGNDIGASIGRRKKIADVYIRLYKTIGIEVGPDDENTDILPFRTSEYNMDEAQPLFSGDKRVMFPKGFSGDQTICIKSSVGLPMTVLAICPSQYTAGSK